MTDNNFKPATILELLRYRAENQPDKLAYTFLVDGKKEMSPVSYSLLDKQAKAIAAYLQQYQAKGERALLLYPQGTEVISAFCGCLYSGVIAIPVPPPESGRLRRTLPRLRSIVQDAKATFALTTESILGLIEEVKDEFPEFDSIKWVDTEKINLEWAEKWQDPDIDKDQIAYLQYTSGSTATPKGVMLTHFNLMHHCGYLKEACGYDENSVSITWMPYFHDYGLVEGMMVPLYNGHPCYLMSPFSFVKRPIQWLKNFGKYKGTHSQAPNFAYDLCVRRFRPKKDAEGLDLSTWQQAGNAAEPINPEVMLKFLDTFSPYGFQWETFAPAYGLAEYTLLASSKPKGTKPVFLKLETSEIEQDRIVEAPDDKEEGVRIFPSCGRKVCDTNIKIVDPDSLIALPEDRVGEIWLSDPSMATGYWQREDATEETFRAYIKDTNEGPFLRTGDLGFYYQGELYITGRIKDLIIIRGTNHYPQDIEWTVQSLSESLRPDYGAAFSVTANGEERLVMVQEVERKAQINNPDELIADIRQEIAEQHEIMPYGIVLAKGGTVLKTASGKIQRRACKQNFLTNNINAVASWVEQ